jgi:hypothetical protein
MVEIALDRFEETIQEFEQVLAVLTVMFLERLLAA